MKGFTLLPVVLAMSIVAVVAFLLNRDNGLNARMITQQSDLERARYAAQAGLQAVNYVLQAAGCNGVYPTAAAPVSNANFRGASYSAHSTTATGSPVTLVATGSYKDASVTLTRSGVPVYQPRTTRVIQPDPGTGQDTFLDSAQERNFGRDTRLRLQSGRYAPLLKISLANLPAGSRVIPWYDSANARLQPGAVLSLYQFDIASSGTGTLMLAAHPITHSWLAGTRIGGGTPDGATWLTYDGANAWSAPGAGYGSVPLATTPYSGAIGWVDWDLTSAVAAWLGGIHPNHGVWIIAAGGSIGNTGYVSANDSTNASWRPKLTLSVLQPCGTGGTTLAPVADAHLKSGSDETRNFGAAAAMDLNYTSPERRILVRFDVSAIPAGTVIKSALLRVYCRSVTSPTSAPKTINAYFVMESWVEGTMSGTGTANGATWLTRNGSVNWTSSGSGSGPGGYYYTSWVVSGKEEASGVSPLPGGFTQGWVSFDITAAAQYWLDNGPGSNFGMLLRMPSTTATDILQFESRESTAGTAPQLVVVYQ
ncbi:MAG TPA: DNRLRE domain-containing protein [Burkholderiales bacterium]|nr:DNRLRE domain-containing protein [Burkholderiales bacterium]